MAASSVMQSILVSPVTGVAITARTVGLKRMTPCCHMPRQQRSSSRLVRCMAKDGQNKEIETPAMSSQKAEVSTDFFDVFAFSGPAPERINGKLAMISFVAAIVLELSNGQDVFAQISNGGIPWFLLTSGVLSVASLIPKFSGVGVESKSKEFFSADAEMWNGDLLWWVYLHWPSPSLLKVGPLCRSTLYEISDLYQDGVALVVVPTKNI